MLIKNIKTNDSSLFQRPYASVDVTLNIWDTAGHERYKSVTKMFYKNADCVVLCYESNNLDSFDRLSYWKTQAEDILDCSNTHFVI